MHFVFFRVEIRAGLVSLVWKWQALCCCWKCPMSNNNVFHLEGRSEALCIPPVECFRLILAVPWAPGSLEQRKCE